MEAPARQADVRSATDKPAVRQLVLQPYLAEVARARQFLREIGEASGLSRDRVFDVTVACSEALANAIEHSAFKGQTKLKTFLYSGRLEVQVEGPGDFVPPCGGKERSHRGWGLPLMAYLSDHLELDSGPLGGTRLSMTFYTHKVAEARRHRRVFGDDRVLALVRDLGLTADTPDDVAMVPTEASPPG